MNEKKKAPMSITKKGIRMLEAHNAQQGNNLHSGQKIMLEIDGEDKEFTIGQKCPLCKFRMHGPNHFQGDHHNNRVKHHSR